MPEITVYSRGQPVTVDIDIRSELERYDWIRPRWTSDKLIAASPFRYDTHPSWFCGLHTGGWHDSGAVDDDWRSGGFVKLLAFLRGESTAETVFYLLAEYPSDITLDEHSANIQLMIPQLTLTKNVITTLDKRILDTFRYRHDYLGGRGISEAVQRLCNVGYDHRRRAVTIPWFDAAGRLAALKYRSVWSRVFWYEPGGAPIRSLIYGIDIVYERRIKRAALVEGEIDAMTLMTAGIPAIATGGAANWTKIKRDIIVRSPLEEIVIVRDNDAAGRSWQRRIIADLSKYIDVSVAVVPGQKKDVNEYVMVNEIGRINRIVGRSRRVKSLSVAIL